MDINNTNLKVLNHPIISHNLAVIRDKNSCCEKFKNALKRITYALVYEATSDIPMTKKEVETPLQKTTCEVFDEEGQLIIAPILRAGMIFCEIAQELLPFANVHHIGMYRDEETLEPVWYYDKRKEIKKNKEKVSVIILDPMLATGNSALCTVKNFIFKGVKEENITFMSLIASPEGVSKLSSNFPKVKIVTAALDEKLNENGYIVPGLGDAGDILFGTK